MCERCQVAAKILEAILPHRDGMASLRKWAAEQKSTDITRMVAVYLILKGEGEGGGGVGDGKDEGKKLNTERLPLHILGDIRQYEGAIDAKDTSKDNKINAMINDRLLRNFLEWNGLINYDYKIKNAIEHIFRVKLD